jgi:hypothetical protein
LTPLASCASQALWRSTRTRPASRWATCQRPRLQRVDHASVVEQLTLGGSGLTAFAGINGGSADPTGLNLTGVNFALAIQTEKNPTAPALAREWTAVKASATGANFVGVSGLTVTATAIDIAITRKATDNTLVDYAAQSLAVQTSTTANPSTMTLDLAANLGEVTRASRQPDH